MVSNIPEHFDEQDIAQMLHLETDQVLVERVTQHIAPVTFVSEFFHHVNPEAPQFLEKIVNYEIGSLSKTFSSSAPCTINLAQII